VAAITGRLGGDQPQKRASDGERHADRGRRRSRRASYRHRSLARGELGSLRVFLTIALIWVIFQLQNDRFLSAINLTT